MDSDEDGVLLGQARAERSGSTVGEKSAQVMKKYPFRDSTTTDGENVWEGDFVLYPFINRINKVGVPIYMINGWFDLFTSDMFLWYVNLSVPRRLIIRPLDYNRVSRNEYDLDIVFEMHRWLDYWLKGIDNRIMDEPSIYYYVMGVPKKNAWQKSDQWPLFNQKKTCFYFDKGKSGTITSINDGFLNTEAPADDTSFDIYTIDYSTSSGSNSRWGSVMRTINYPNMRDNDKKALTYTTSPLKKKVEVTGHPIVHLWFVTDIQDLDVFIYLEEVDSKGNSTYITEGNLRASHRSQSSPPYDNIDLPYHSHYKSHLEPIDAIKPFELIFDLLPTSFLFKAGNRIRIIIAFADADNFDTPVLDPSPTLKLLTSTSFPSYIELPVVQNPKVK